MTKTEIATVVLTQIFCLLAGAYWGWRWRDKRGDRRIMPWRRVKDTAARSRTFTRELSMEDRHETTSAYTEPGRGTVRVRKASWPNGGSA